VIVYAGTIGIYTISTDYASNNVYKCVRTIGISNVLLGMYL